VHARTPGRFGVVGPLVGDGRRCLQLMRTARVGERGSLRSINPRRRKGESLTSPLSAGAPLPSAFLLRLRAPLLSFVARFAFARHR
jgi:hypothetical protein